jgi:hypothetical protein
MCDGAGVFYLLGGAFDDEIEPVSGEAERAPGVSSEIPSLAGLLSCLEPKGVVDPQRANTSHVGTAVMVDGRQPTGVAVGSAGTRSLGYTLPEADCDGVPVEQRKFVEIGEVLGVDGRLWEGTVRGHSSTIVPVAGLARPAEEV